VSVYLALHTSGSPSVQDVADFGRLALLFGATPDQPLAVQRADSGALTVVLPISDEDMRGGRP
jgi:hypothetical protein